VVVGMLLTYRRVQVKDRLSGIREMNMETEAENMLRLPFMERVVVPMLSGMGNTLGNLAPREIRTKMEKRILYAGTPGNITFPLLVAVQMLLGGAFLVLSMQLLSFIQVEGFRLALITLLATLIGFFLPIGIINNQGEARQKAIERALPDMLDLLLVSVEAGLGFDMALKKVTQQMAGPLSEEIRQALDEMRMGSIREDALRGIARRTGVVDLSRFISSVIQAEQLGSNIAGTLRVQADYIRQKRRQRAEEAAMKAPVKLIFPLLFFIFPALFVVILGPAVIGIFRFFMTL
jgi:tight adherence protein C